MHTQDKMHVLKTPEESLSFYHGLSPDLSAGQLNVEGVIQQSAQWGEVCGFECACGCACVYLFLFVLGAGIQGHLCQNIS